MGTLSRATVRANENKQTSASLQLISNSALYATKVKPAIDVIGGLVLIVLLLPFLLIATALAWLSLGSPALYKQDRIGLNGETFRLYKLRTMVPDRRISQSGYVGPERRQTHKSPKDPRVTRIGRFLRATRLDELPQLWNVIKGDMSLVGPRPELPEIVAGYAPWQHKRHLVKPGVTGLWQVSHHNGKPMHECTEVDIEYVASTSLKTDLSIFLRTPAAMFFRRGY